MRNKRLLLCFASLTVWMLSIPIVSAQTSFNRETLRGLKGVKVSVDGITPSIKADGLSPSTIQTDTELKLRKFGIRVLTDAEFDKTPGAPSLYVVILPFKGKQNVYSYHLYVRLRERVFLQRDSSIFAWVPTYETPGFLGMVGANYVSDLRGIASDQVDIFVNDYLAANRK